MILTNTSKRKFSLNPNPFFLPTPLTHFPYSHTKKQVLLQQNIQFRQFQMELIGWIAAPDVKEYSTG